MECVHTSGIINQEVKLLGLPSILKRFLSFFANAKAVFLPSPQIAPVTKAISASSCIIALSFLVFQHRFTIGLRNAFSNTQTLQIIA